MSELIELGTQRRLLAELTRLRGAIDFIISLAEEEYGHSKVGTGAEVALRHIIRKAREARDQS